MELRAGLRPAWSSTSFLLYTGAFAVAGSLGILLATLGEMHGSIALVGWSALFLALLLASAVAARHRAQHVLAGLSAFVAVGSFGVLLGSLLDAIGLADDVDPFDRDFELAPLLIEAAVLVAALAAARAFRLPLLVLAASAAKVVLVLDTTAGIFGLGGWVATAALLLGLAELGIALALEGGDRRSWAFWKHVSAALLIGGAAIWFLDGGDVGWVLIGLAALGYVALARSFGRSVWAVMGAVGLFLATTHFVDESYALVSAIPFYFPSEEGGGIELWQTALVYTALGVVYALLGLVLRQPTTHDPPPV
jgi:hypothetical protein